MLCFICKSNDPHYGVTICNWHCHNGQIMFVFFSHNTVYWWTVNRSVHPARSHPYLHPAQDVFFLFPPPIVPFWRDDRHEPPLILLVVKVKSVDHLLLFSRRDEILHQEGSENIHGRIFVLYTLQMRLCSFQGDRIRLFSLVLELSGEFILRLLEFLPGCHVLVHHVAHLGPNQLQFSVQLKRREPHETTST